MASSMYRLRCFLASDLLAVQFPPSFDELDDAIISAIESSPKCTKDILKDVNGKLENVSKNTVNSRLYTMLSRGNVVRQSSSSNAIKAPIWSLI
jgi:hypothetical protein